MRPVASDNHWENVEWEDKLRHRVPEHHKVECFDEQHQRYADNNHVEERQQMMSERSE